MDPMKSTWMSYQVTPGVPHIGSSLQISSARGLTVSLPLPISLPRHSLTWCECPRSSSSTVTLTFTHCLMDGAATTTAEGAAYTCVEVVTAVHANDKSLLYDFGTVSLRTVFGVKVVLTFSAEGIKDILQIILPQERCVSSYMYAVLNTSTCALCPSFATCDGTAAIVPYPGFWRGARDSTVMYPCIPADSCVSSMTCAPQYTGAMCASCVDGYGRSGKGSPCVQCASPAINWTVTTFLVLAVSAVIFFLSIRTIPFSSVSDVRAGLVRRHVKGNTIALAAKICISHVQLLALAPLSRLELPSWLRGMMAVGAQGGSFLSVNVPFVSCALGNSAFERLCAAALEIPVVVCILLVPASVMAWLHHRRFINEAKRVQREALVATAKKLRASAIKYRAADEARIAVTFDDDAKSRRAAQQSHEQLIESYEGDDDVCDDDDHATTTTLVKHQLIDHEFRKLQLHGVAVPAPLERVFNVFMVVVVAVSFFLYPSIVQVAIQGLQCEVVDYGNQGTRSVMALDARIFCDTAADFTRNRITAGIIIAIVGVGVPILSPAAVVLTHAITCDTMESARNLFFFATGGYRLWFWESVSLARKLFVTFVTVISVAGQLPFLLSCWVFVASFILNVVLRPWEDTILGRMEQASLATLATTHFLFAMMSCLDVVTAASDVNKTIVFAVCFGVNVLFFFFAGLSLFLAAGQQVVLQVAESIPEANAMLGRVNDIIVHHRIQTLINEISRLKRHLGSAYPRQALLYEEEASMMRDDAAAVARVLKFVRHSSALCRDCATQRARILSSGSVTPHAIRDSMIPRRPRMMDTAFTSLTRRMAHHKIPLESPYCEEDISMVFDVFPLSEDNSSPCRSHREKRPLEAVDRHNAGRLHLPRVCVLLDVSEKPMSDDPPFCLDLMFGDAERLLPEESEILFPVSNGNLEWIFGDFEAPALVESSSPTIPKIADQDGSAPLMRETAATLHSQKHRVSSMDDFSIDVESLLQNAVVVLEPCENTVTGITVDDDAATKPRCDLRHAEGTNHHLYSEFAIPDNIDWFVVNNSDPCHDQPTQLFIGASNAVAESMLEGEGETREGGCLLRRPAWSPHEVDRRGDMLSDEDDRNFDNRCVAIAEALEQRGGSPEMNSSLPSFPSEVLDELLQFVRGSGDAEEDQGGLVSRLTRSSSSQLHPLPIRSAAAKPFEKKKKNIMKVAIQTVRRAHVVLLALRHVLPRCVDAAKLLTTYDDSQALTVYAEDLYSAEKALLLAWLRVLRLCGEFPGSQRLQRRWFRFNPRRRGGLVSVATATRKSK